MHPMPHLAFNGNCAEAVRFCASGLDGNLEVLMSGADSPTASCTCDWP
jgi:PhnB protein